MNTTTPIPGTQGQAISGNPQGDGVGGGQQAQITAQPGTLDYLWQKLISMAKSGNYDGADEILSEKAKGVANDMLKNSLPEDKVESYKKLFDNLQPLSAKAVGSGKQFVFRHANGTLITVVVGKDGAAFKIRDVQIKEGKK